MTFSNKVKFEIGSPHTCDTSLVHPALWDIKLHENGAAQRCRMVHCQEGERRSIMHRGVQSWEKTDPDYLAIGPTPAAHSPACKA
eukprot:86354-Pelagomonas_calceolata.AAC.1